MSKRHSSLYYDSSIPSSDLSVWAGNRDLLPEDSYNMSDRYSRYGGRRTSPPLYNPNRASLPINLAYPEQQPHLHIVPTSRRELTPAPRSSNSSVTNAGTVTTTYKVTSDPPSHGSHLRESSRSRRSTLDNHNRPTIVTTSRAHRPVVHSGGGIRPGSPSMKNPYRSSEEDYVVTPATSSRHGHHHHHKKHYSATMDNADVNRIARDREDSRLRVVPARESNYRTRARPIYNGTIVRHADTISDDYGDDGYGYTNPQDLVRYDLDRGTPAPVAHRSRRDSFDGNRSRPTSIAGYNDIQRSYDARERGPPPSMRGFDKIRPPPYDQASLRMPRPPSPGNSMAPMEPVARPPPFEPVEPIRRSNSSSARPRPTSYHERDRPRGPREDYYEVRDDDRRHRQDSYDDRVESRGFGIRTDRPDRPESRSAIRGERPIERSESRAAARPERPESRSVIRPERTERVERSDRPDRGPEPEKKEHKGRDALATGLSLAGAALGIKAVKNAARDDRKGSDSDEREERRQREYEEESRKRRDKDRDDEDSRRRRDIDEDDSRRRRDKDRDERDRATRDDVSPTPRDAPPLARDVPPPSRDIRESREKTSSRSPIEPSTIRVREPERKSSRDERDSDKERERHVRRSEAALSGTAIDSSDTASDEGKPRERRETRPRGTSTATAAAVGAAAAGAAIPAFNPKDTMDLKALKEALNQKEASKPIVKESKENIKTKETTRTPRQSGTKDINEAAKIREDLRTEQRGRDPLAPTSTENRQLRVVSPPREKLDDKPVKGILRQPREKFPEDPTPIREGVAPLKDAKKDGIPPDARWTKISRKLVNPDALEAGKERYEARDDFVIVLRVLSRDEVQGYAEVTQKIRAAREELEEMEAADRRRARRERHERHKKERSSDQREHTSKHQHRRDREREHERHDRSQSESDTTEDEYERGDRTSDKPKMLEPAKRKATFEDAMMTGGLGASDIGVGPGGMGNLKENPIKPGVYSGYVRNPPLSK